MSTLSNFADSKTHIYRNKEYMSVKPINLDDFSSECSDLIGNADDACRSMLGQSRLIQIDADTNLIHEIMENNFLMLILKGRIRVYKDSPEGREVTLYHVESGQLCVHNLNNQVTDLINPIMARTESDVLGLTLTRSVFNKAMENSTSFRNYVLRILSERLLSMGDLISGFAFDHLDYRIACWLNQQFKYGLEDPIQITHNELAHELGTTREMISRILKELEYKGCIQLARGRIHLRNAYSLKLISQGKKQIY